MKKIIATLLAAAMVLSLCACGGSSSGNSSAAASTAKSEAAAAASSAKSEAAAAASSAKSEAAAAASSAKSEAAAAETSEAGEPEVSADGPTFNLKFASTENEGTLRYQMLEKPIMDLITEKSNGRITFTFFPSGSLVGSGAVIKGCQDGTCDIGMDNINSYPGVFRYSELLVTPGISLGDDFDTQAASIKTYCDAYATQEYKNNGIYLIGTSPAMPVVLMSKFPVDSLDSYSGKTICCNGAYTAMFDGTGAATTWSVPPEQYEALHLNVIDATLNGSGVLQAFKFYEVLDYAYYIPFSIMTSSYVMSQKVYESMPEDLQKVIDDFQLSEEFFNINKAYIDEMTKQVETACAENENFQFLDFPAEVAEAMKASSLTNVEQKVAELNSNGLDGDGALELLNSFAK